MPEGSESTIRPDAGRTPVTAAVWMITACAALASMAGMIRHVSQEIHPFEVAFFRNFVGILVMTPWLARVGWAGLRTQRQGMFLLRGIFGISAMLAWFWALSVMPLAEATALSFTAPLFSSVLAVLILGEIVRARRWGAIAVGFIGALMILRPGVETISVASLAVLFSSLMMASSIIVIKSLSRTESPSAIVTYMVLYLTPLSLGPALFVWTTPSWNALFWMMAIGLLATGAHQCLTRAFAAAETSAVMAFDFTRLIFAATIGFVVFGEVPDLWTWLGAAIIVAASVYIAHREARVARSARVARDAAARREGH
jgi:drug/metabolite transporter (DMT)-like permease